MGAGHGHGHAAGRKADRGRLRVVLLVTATVMVVEVVGALLTGSLALLADAGHMATDAGGVVLALGASYLASRPAGPRSTFGYHRAEVLAALANALVLLGLCGYLAYAGVTRLDDPPSVEAGAMVLFALVGLAANGVSMVVLSRADGTSLNMRGAVNEVLADLVGSVLAIAAGVVILLWGWDRADPVASLVIAALIVPRALLLLRDSAAVLLEVAPKGLDLDRRRAPPPPRRRRRRRARPARLDHHQRHPEPLGPRHRHRRGPGRPRRRRDPGRPVRVRRRALRRPPRDVPGRARHPPRPTRTSASCTSPRS